MKEVWEYFAVFPSHNVISTGYYGPITLPLVTEGTAAYSRMQTIRTNKDHARPPMCPKHMQSAAIQRHTESDLLPKFVGGVSPFNCLDTEVKPAPFLPYGRVARVRKRAGGPIT
jgi:hypothetical protein